MTASLSKLEGLQLADAVWFNMIYMICTSQVLCISLKVFLLIEDLEIINETLSTNPVGQSLVVCDPSPSASVCITNIPHNCDLESHLRDVLDVLVLNIEFSDDMLSASIELADVTG